MKTYPVLDLQATGERIKKLRMERRMSVTDICNYMGFENPQAVYKWQRGETLPTVDNLFALSYLFETPMENILCAKESRERDSFLLYKEFAFMRIPYKVKNSLCSKRCAAREKEVVALQLARARSVRRDAHFYFIKNFAPVLNLWFNDRQELH